MLLRQRESSSSVWLDPYYSVWQNVSSSSPRLAHLFASCTRKKGSSLVTEHVLQSPAYRVESFSEGAGCEGWQPDETRRIMAYLNPGPQRARVRPKDIFFCPHPCHDCFYPWRGASFGKLKGKGGLRCAAPQPSPILLASGKGRASKWLCSAFLGHLRCCSNVSKPV